MSWEWTTRNKANYLLHNEGSETQPGYPMSKIAFFKLAVKPEETSNTQFIAIAQSGTDGGSNAYSSIGAVDYVAQEWPIMGGSFGTYQGRDINMSLDATKWYGIAAVYTNATSRKLYCAEVGTAFSASTHTTDMGSVLRRQITAIGAQWRPSGVGAGMQGRVARAAIWWGTALTDQQVQDIFDGTIEPSSISSGLWGYWKGVNGSLADTSGNSRTMGIVGTVASSTDDPFVEAPPTISSVTPSTFADGRTGVIIAGTNFGASQGTGKVWISPTGSVNNGSKKEQTVTAWSNTSITITTTRGT